MVGSVTASCLLTAQAQNDTGADLPGWTLSLGGAFSHTGYPGTPAPNNNTFSVQGDIGLGYFITEHIQTEVSLGAASSGNSDGFNHGQMNYLIAAKYHLWPRKDFVPYFGIQGGGVTRFSPGQTSFNPAGGGMAGINYFLTEKHRTSIFLEYNFLYSHETTFNQDIFDNKVKVGFQFWFSR